MNWSAVPPLWQQCFALAWEAFREGSNPIGALVADAAGQVVATGKSAVRAELSGVMVSHTEIAHAEVNALLKLDNRTHDKARAAGYTLYATLEPCPLCFSAFYMSDVRQLKYAAPDAYGGSTNLMGSTRYFSRKQRRVEGPVTGLDDVSIFLNVYHDVRFHTAANEVHRAFSQDYLAAVEQATLLADAGTFGIEQEQEAGVVFDRVRAVLE